MLQKLKVELPPSPENMLTLVDGYVRCPICQAEYTRLTDRGLCLDCEEKETDKAKKQAKQRLTIEASIGLRGLKEFTFQAYREVKENSEALKLCKAFNQATDNLYLHGSCGSGKTHLAGATWRLRVEEGLQCEFLKHPELSRLFRGKEVEEENILLKKFADFDVLVIDDLGVGRSTEFANQILYEILDARISNYKNGLILTSNVSLEEFAVKAGDDRLASRIAGLCKVVKLAGKDHRLS